MNRRRFFVASGTIAGLVTGNGHYESWGAESTIQLHRSPDRRKAGTATASSPGNHFLTPLLSSGRIRVAVTAGASFSQRLRVLYHVFGVDHQADPAYHPSWHWNDFVDVQDVQKEYPRWLEFKLRETGRIYLAIAGYARDDSSLGAEFMGLTNWHMSRVETRPASRLKEAFHLGFDDYGPGDAADDMVVKIWTE